MTESTKHSDLRTTLDYWRRLSPFGKAWALVGLFSGVSSIASISQNIVTWHGFLLDVVRFYQNLTSLVSHLVDMLFNVHPSQNTVDSAVMGILVAVPYLRATYASIHLAKNIGERHMLLVYCWLLAGGLLVASVVGLFVDFTPTFPPLTAVVLTMFGVVRGLAMKEKSHWMAIKIFWSYLSTILLLFAIAVGINTGIQALAS